MRDRLVQLCVKAYMFGSEQVIIDLPSLIGFVEAELDKAREEGIVDYYSVDELYAIEDAFHSVLRNGGEWDDIGESAREKNWELIKLTTK